MMNGNGSFSQLVWDTLTPEMRIVLLVFFEAGDSLTRHEAIKRVKEKWYMTESEIEEWRQRAVFGSRPDYQ